MKRAVCNAKCGFSGMFLIFLMLIGLTSSALSDSWATKADMLTPMSNIFTIVVNGKIYAIGGTGEQIGIGQQSSISMMEKYDPIQDVWTTEARITTERFNSSISGVNGKIYIIGGYDSNGLISRVDEYDPATGTWTKKADMPTLRTGLSTIAINGKLYAIGGEKLVGGALSNVEEYDPVKNTWKEKADMLAARTNFYVVGVNDRIYVIGRTDAQPVGMNGEMAIFSAMEEYNPETDTWTQKADIPTPRNSPSVAVANGKIYVIGGTSGRIAGGEIGQGVLQTVEQYDPATDTWTQKADIPTPRNSPSVAILNGKIYVIGGVSGRIAGGEVGQLGNLQTIEQYDPATDTWTQKTNVPTPRSNPSVAVANSKIYVIGGTGTQEGVGGIGRMVILPTVEGYTPDDGQSYSVSPAGKLVITWGSLKTQK